MEGSARDIDDSASVTFKPNGFTLEALDDCSGSRLRGGDSVHPSYGACDQLPSLPNLRIVLRHSTQLFEKVLDQVSKLNPDLEPGIDVADLELVWDNFLYALDHTDGRDDVFSIILAKVRGERDVDTLEAISHCSGVYTACEGSRHRF